MAGQIHVLGVPRTCGPIEAQLLGDADLLVGSPRQCALVPAPEGLATMDWSAGIDAVCTALSTCVQPVVLASGDPGFFGIVRKLNQFFTPDQIVVLPAPSSVSLAFGLLGMTWSDAVVASAHGRAIQPAIALARANPKVAILTEPGDGIERIAAGMAGFDREVYVVADIGGEHQRVGRHEAGMTWPDPNVVIVVDPKANAVAMDGTTPPPSRAGMMIHPVYGRDETAYDHRDGMITKAEVRALALAWLAPGPGQIIWDLGCGSGSVAVEAASSGAAVFACDHDDAQVARTRQNAQRHGVYVSATHAKASDAVTQWMRIGVADAAFIGGGGEDALEAVLTAQVDRVVLALAAIDRVIPIIERLEGLGYQVQATQLMANRLSPLPNGQRRFKAMNPVTIIQGVR